MSSSNEQPQTNERFIGDHYERLQQGAEVLAQDPAVREAPFPFNDDGLRAFVATVANDRLLDHLDEHEANTVVALLLVDFHRGAARVAARVRQLVRQVEPDSPSEKYHLAVISGLAGVLAVMVDAAAWAPASVHRSLGG